MKDESDILDRCGLTFFKCGDEQSDSSVTEALLLVFKAGEIADKEGELAALIARLSGHPKRGLFIVVCGEDPEAIEGASKFQSSELASAALPISVRVHSSEENAPDPGLPMAEEK